MEKLIRFTFQLFSPESRRRRCLLNKRLGGLYSLAKCFEEKNNFLHLLNQDHDPGTMQPVTFHYTGTSNAARHVSLYRHK